MRDTHGSDIALKVFVQAAEERYKTSRDYRRRLLSEASSPTAQRRERMRRWEREVMARDEQGAA